MSASTARLPHEIRPWHSDAEDVAGLNLARLAERLLHRLPVGVYGGRHCRRADDHDETENNDRGVQSPKSHGQDLPLHLTYAQWSRATFAQLMFCMSASTYFASAAP